MCMCISWSVCAPSDGSSQVRRSATGACICTRPSVLHTHIPISSLTSTRTTEPTLTSISHTHTYPHSRSPIPTHSFLTDECRAGVWGVQDGVQGHRHGGGPHRRVERAQGMRSNLLRSGAPPYTQSVERVWISFQCAIRMLSAGNSVQYVH